MFRVGDARATVAAHARESARRSACVNNLKQIGLGLHGHLSARRTFPAGYVGVLPGQSGNAWDSTTSPTADNARIWRPFSPTSARGSAASRKRACRRA
ncbi:DUF1559 domain-containing protein [bacterium]|nr:DUF1559 domain-containing protein [bacterium]